MVQTRCSLSKMSATMRVVFLLVLSLLASTSAKPVDDTSTGPSLGSTVWKWIKYPFNWIGTSVRFNAITKIGKTWRVNLTMLCDEYTCQIMQCYYGKCNKTVCDLQSINVSDECLIYSYILTSMTSDVSLSSERPTKWTTVSIRPSVGATQTSIATESSKMTSLPPATSTSTHIPPKDPTTKETLADALPLTIPYTSVTTSETTLPPLPTEWLKPAITVSTSAASTLSTNPLPGPIFTENNVTTNAQLLTVEPTLAAAPPAGTLAN